MLTVSQKFKLTVIVGDFPTEVDRDVAEHNSLLQCPSPQEYCSECAKAQDGTLKHRDLHGSRHRSQNMGNLRVTS